jgi:DUF1365 family protein
MQSCLYRGWVRHRRYAPLGHAFRYRVFLLYLALDELEQGLLSAARLSPLFSIDRPNLISFRRRDYLGDARVPLDRAVRDLVERETGRRPAGRIALLTHPRYFGYVMNPVSFYYCYTPAGDAVDTVVAEIENTPWGERHAYVLDEAQNLGSLRHKRYRFDKRFHVSPFMPMQQTYDWRFRTPGEHVAVHMQSFEQRGPALERVFDATMALRRQPLDGRALHGALLRHPFMTGKVIAAIYWQALRLWLARAPFHEHPAGRTPGRTRTSAPP